MTKDTFVRYAQTMKTVGESKRYKRVSTAHKKAEQWCDIDVSNMNEM